MGSEMCIRDSPGSSLELPMVLGHLLSFGLIDHVVHSNTIQLNPTQSGPIRRTPFSSSPSAHSTIPSQTHNALFWIWPCSDLVILQLIFTCYLKFAHALLQRTYVRTVCGIDLAVPSRPHPRHENYAGLQFPVCRGNACCHDDCAPRPTMPDLTPTIIPNHIQV